MNLPIGRYWRTLKHLRAEQLRYLVVRRVLGYPRSVALTGPIIPRTGHQSVGLLPLTRAVFDGETGFSFLGITRNFTQGIDWEATDNTRLWRYNLHYFEWVRQNDVADETTAKLRHAPQATWPVPRSVECRRES